MSAYTHESAVSRFNSSFVVNGETGCWEWSKGLNKCGYGYFAFKKNDKHITRGAHCFSYFLEHGHFASDDGLDIDHLCRNRACVNPQHLEAVTTRENVLRGLHPSMVTHVTGICKRGHVVQKDMKSKTCLQCLRDRNRAKTAHLKATETDAERAARLQKNHLSWAKHGAKANAIRKAKRALAKAVTCTSEKAA